MDSCLPAAGAVAHARMTRPGWDCKIRIADCGIRIAVNEGQSPLRG
ncbi:MAG: hypothetical protein ACUZ8N_17610 [Candidatus Scalindua sp.]